MYSPDLGRFVSRYHKPWLDLNWYQFQFGQPSVFLDPLGDPTVVAPPPIAPPIPKPFTPVWNPPTPTPTPTSPVATTAARASLWALPLLVYYGIEEQIIAAETESAYYEAQKLKEAWEAYRIAREAAIRRELLRGAAEQAKKALGEAKGGDGGGPFPPPPPPQKPKCLPCDPPVGTVMWETHRVPPHDQHWPCPCDHAHNFEVNQMPPVGAPEPCKCFLKRDRFPVKCLLSSDPDPTPELRYPVGGGLAP